jgi:hypothetical protein
MKRGKKMSDNPFKEEEPLSVFKDAPVKKEATEISFTKQDSNQEDGGYSQFPKWDLLPPFKLIKRGRNQ